MVAIRYGLSIKIVKFMTQGQGFLCLDGETQCIYCLKIFFSTIGHVVGKLTAWLE